MEIRKVPISLLNAAPYNPRKDLQPGDPEYQKIARSIEKYGCVEPIIWNEKTGNVIGGHQRLKVLAATGAVEVDVSVVQLSLEDEKALNLALNKISGQWDNEKLSAVLQDLSAGFDVEVTGFDQHEVDALVASCSDKLGTMTVFFPPGWTACTSLGVGAALGCISASCAGASGAGTAAGSSALGFA